MKLLSVEKEKQPYLLKFCVRKNYYYYSKTTLFLAKVSTNVPGFLNVMVSMR
jgi:hypothetical protein